MKRIFSLLVTGMLLFITTAFTSLDRTPYPKTMEEVRILANQEIEDTIAWQELYPNPNYIQGSWLYLNEESWQNHQALAYGQSFGTLNQGQIRYLGFNPLGEEFPNPKYPPDHQPVTIINEYAWQEAPWRNQSIGQRDLYKGLPNEQELRSALRQKIIDGLKYNYPDKFNAADSKEWEKYTLIIQPPTKYTWGYGRMWHKWDSDKDGTPELWYVTMSLAPDVLPPKVVPPPAPKEPDSLPCTEKPSITNTWEELYEWQVFHPETCSGTDGQGNSYEYDCSWWEPQSAIVPYAETLTAALSVNTKQGIANGGRESRAAWEIIPFARRNRLDPNEVTRSGYGFEVKLVTTYENDWEDHIPAGASAHGGSFKGPDQAVAEFYDTKGRFVKRINLVPTKGKAGDKSITWELPSERYIFKDGTTIYERKHYIDINVPDGKYLVKVTVSGAGKTDLCLIQKKQVTIYGDMYEDDYTRISTQDE